ncbi:MAG TPA: response regulator [Desulfobacterales bacterium]|nr:MAG: response regulator [Deltaproteobacteria bacterium]HHC24831.1 response regulator [Desulfobacterales bacterium]
MIKAKILIVEDEIAEGMCLRFVFEVLGYDVCSLAASGQQAIRIANDEQPDVVLMDILLPGDMDGIETAQEIRIRFGIPFIYVTGYEDPEIMERAKRTYPIGYFLKPVRYQDIRKVIDAAFQKPDKMSAPKAKP